MEKSPPADAKGKAELSTDEAPNASTEPKDRAESRTEPNAGQPKQLNALEEAKRVSGEGPHPIHAFLVGLFGHLPGFRTLLGLEKDHINYDPRQIFFNSPIPDELLDPTSRRPKAKYATNKVRTTKYTPLNFLPRNILFQFENLANIYFLMVAIFSGFSIFGVNNAGLASVPIIAIVVITALRDGFEDWRRQVQDLEVNNCLTTALYNIPNENSPIDNVGPWRKFKKSCSRFYRRTWNRMRRRESDVFAASQADVNDNQSMSSGSVLEPSRTHEGSFQDEKPVFLGKFWKDVQVGDIIKVYADQGVPADMVVLSSSDPEGDCFIDTRSLDGETSLKPRRALNSTKHIRKAWHAAECKFMVNIAGANSDLNTFGWTFVDHLSDATEALGPSNFLPRGSTVRNSRWIIGYVVYTGIETKIVLNAGETPSKRSRLARDLNFYVAWSFIFLFIMCLVSGVVEGVKFRNKSNIAYFFDGGLQTKNAALNGFVTFFAAMLVLQNLVPISLYISIEIARTCLAFFIYSDWQMYDEETDYPCTPKSWALSDDLGQIEFIFSDKTGTLTQNSMIFRKCTINGKAYGTAFTESMAGQIKRNDGDVDAIRAQMTKLIAEEQEQMWARLDVLYRNPYVAESTTLVSEPIVADLQGESGEVQHRAIEQFALVMALCNTVVTDIHESEPFEDGNNDPVGPHGSATSNRDKRRSAVSLAASEAAAMAAANDSWRKSAGTTVDDVMHLPYPRGRQSAGLHNQFEDLSEPPRISIASHRSNRARVSTDHSTHRVVSSGVYGGAGRSVVSSARPKHTLDYRNMEGKTLVHKAESPDESALVTMARDLGYTLVEDGKHHKIVDMQGSFHRFEVLQTLLFTSHRKRMSILVKNEADRYFLLMKGADSMMETLLNAESLNSPLFAQTVTDLEKFGDEGLRTLMVGYRELAPKFALDWSRRVSEANTLPNRDELIAKLAEEIECEVSLLGGTGIEDQLQEDVPHTIETLGKAGIKLWMLTGDKVETAISIGFSCNLLNTSMELLIVQQPEELADRLRDMNLEVTKQTLKEAGADHRPAQGKYALIIDGKALSALVSSKEYRLQFALLGKKCKSVLCCRVSPSQKAAVVHIMKSTFDVTTLAIGDGANDVSMIQEADVGVGIVGVEGRQAAMSSDFAIGQFRFLQRLILVHGRWSYKRVASMINTLLFENFMFSVTLFWYGIYNQYDQSYLYDYTYLTLFNSVFVSVPVVMRGIFDQDLPDWALLKFPGLYGQGILRKEWTKPIYFLTVLDGIYQSAVAFFFAYSCFFTGRFYTHNGLDIAYRQGLGVLACATAVFACNTYVLLGQSRWDWLTLVVYIVSCALVFAWTGIYTSFVASNFFYNAAERVYDTMVFWAYFLVSLVAALLPRFVCISVKRIWFPDDADIVREQLHFGQLKHPSGNEENIDAADSSQSMQEKPKM